jgi:hypothetical protein
LSAPEAFLGCADVVVANLDRRHAVLSQDREVQFPDPAGTE